MSDTPLLDPLALEVSTAFGYVTTLDCVNRFRYTIGHPPMTEAEYDSAVKRCMTAGLEAVRTAHLAELDRLMYGWKGATDRKTADAINNLAPAFSPPKDAVDANRGCKADPYDCRACDAGTGEPENTTSR